MLVSITDELVRNVQIVASLLGEWSEGSAMSNYPLRSPYTA